ncbi:hypothetical protein Sjap_011086 [Stephania japonica]|uniref:C2 domain-containing protein n=1 Tax=Stephania japonica TaxID=461633 RepID=A0AAP0P568_9MAGN
MTVEDSRRVLPNEYYPSWAASELIKTSVEPVLEQYRPIVLSSLKFSKFTLGTKFSNNAENYRADARLLSRTAALVPIKNPLKTTKDHHDSRAGDYLEGGVQIVEDGGEGITMELEMQWDGNPSIILDIKTRLGVGLPVQIKNIGFTGVFRLIFKPLVEEFPCFGAVCYSLRHKKKLDFTLKVVGGDISTIPGLSDAIDVSHICSYSFRWYVRLQDSIVLNENLNTETIDLELKPVGVLEVKLVQAKGLTNKDIIGKSDPYAVLYIRPLRDRTKTSKVINNDLNPIWNEHFEFTVEDATTQHLTVKVFDDEGLQASELIGCAQVSLKDLEPGRVKDTWLKLVKDLEVQRDNKNRGQVHLELLYYPFGMENGFTNPFAPNLSMTSLEKALKGGADGTEAADVTQKRREVIVRGVLSVTVISAEDLPPADIMGKADPFVVLQLKKTGNKNKTRVVNDNLNPVWNQTFDFVVEDGLHDMLIVEVYDHDTFGKDYMGRCILTLTRVILETEYKDSIPLEGAKSGRIHPDQSRSPIPHEETHSCLHKNPFDTFSRDIIPLASHSPVEFLRDILRNTFLPMVVLSRNTSPHSPHGTCPIDPSY